MRMGGHTNRPAEASRAGEHEWRRDVADEVRPGLTFTESPLTAAPTIGAVERIPLWRGVLVQVCREKSVVPASGVAKRFVELGA